jgi:deferrochelatase/peroxidase EfeB
MHADVPESQINNFDYAPTAYHSTVYDDFEGMRCPVGAHARRMNPRGATVTGKPHSRRIIRRGLPYGAAFDPANPHDGVERGLVGSFICGDLEMQFAISPRRACATRAIRSWGINRRRAAST